MRRNLIALALAALALGSGCSSSSPAAPSPPPAPSWPGSRSSLEIAISPNPITAVPGTSPAPFAITYEVTYRESARVGLNVPLMSMRVVLTDGSVGASGAIRFPSGSYRVPGGCTGSFGKATLPYVARTTYPGGTVAPTRPDGTLTVSWDYTDDNGNSGTATASAQVVGSP